jgi:nitrite reductase/ring-hydroxylating ferredoxin subunit
LRFSHHFLKKTALTMTTTTEFKLHDLLELCASADVAPNCATKVDKNGLSLAVYHLDDGYYVTDDQCTHGPGSLSEGCIEGDIIECDFHNGAFNIRTGEVVTPPCMIPLRTYAVHTIDGKVYIDPNQPALAADLAGVGPRRHSA